MMEPIPIQNVPPQMDSPGRRPPNRKAQNQKSNEKRAQSEEQAKDGAAGTRGHEREPPQCGSDGIVGTLVDLEG